MLKPQPISSWDPCTIAAGCLAGIYATWQGIASGKSVVELNVRWCKVDAL